MVRLTLKQEAFCLAYTGVCAGNATAAYKMAGYHVSSDNVAGVNGNNCLKKPAIQARIRAIQARIRAIQQEAAKNSKVMTPQQMQERLSRIARREVEAADGKAPSLHAALKALELLCKMQGLFLQRQEVSFTQAVPVVIQDDIKEGAP